MTISTIPVHKLDPMMIKSEDRAREDYGDLQELLENIKEKGQIQPITVRALGGGFYKLLAGGRRHAAHLLGELPTIDAIVRETEDEIDEKEIELFENIFRKDFTWQERAKLEKEIHELKAKKEGFTYDDTAALLGVSRGAIGRHITLANALEAIPELSKLKNEDDAWKALRKLQEEVVVKEMIKRSKDKQSKTTTPHGKKGEEEKFSFWQYADNHYSIGSCIEAMEAMADGIVHFAEVDPPYGIGLDRGEMKRGGDTSNYNEVPAEAYPEFIKKVASQVYRVLDDNTFCLWWFGPTHFYLVQETLREVGFTVDDIPAIWYKTNHSGQTNQPGSALANQYEPFFIARKKKPLLRKQGRGNVFAFDPTPPAQKIHPTERPIELIRELLQTFAYPGMRTMSPFLGSGTTILAAYAENMICFGWDLSEAYKDKFLLRAKAYEAALTPPTEAKE